MQRLSSLNSSMVIPHPQGRAGRNRQPVLQDRTQQKRKGVVAGIEVLRDAQMNMMPSTGSHEGQGTCLHNLERYKDRSQ